MKGKDRGLNLSRYWPFGSLHFGIHIIMGLVASSAGLVVIFNQKQIMSGLALIGAGSFAIINGWHGFVDIRASAVEKRYMNSREGDR